MSSDSECETLVKSNALVTWDEARREEDDGEGWRGGTASLVHTPTNRYTSTENIVLMHARTFLGMQGAEASENSVYGE